MTSRDHLHAAARCWEHAGFFEEAAERFTTAEAWRDAGRCFSQAERHSEAALAFSRASEPLLQAREHLMASWSEGALSLYERLRSERLVSPSAQIEVLLGLGEVEEAIRVTSTSGDREAAARLALFAGTRGRPDLAAPWGPELSFASWNRNLRWQRCPPVAEATKIWPSVEFSEVALVPIWREVTRGSPIWSDRTLVWAADGKDFAAALNWGLAHGLVKPEGVRLVRLPFSKTMFCTAFLPASQAVLTGNKDGEVHLVREDGSVQLLDNFRMPNSVRSITFAPGRDRVALSSAGDGDGAWLKVCAWRTDHSKTRLLEELQEPKGNCAPLAAWSPDGHRLIWSPGPVGQPNRLFILIPAEGREAIQAHDALIRSLNFTFDGRFLITASHDRTVVVRDGENGQSLAPPEHFSRPVYGATVHPQAALVAVGEGNRLHLLRLHPGEAPRLSRLSEQMLDEDVQSLAFSPDGRHLLVMTSGHLQLFRVDLNHDFRGTPAV